MWQFPRMQERNKQIGANIKRLRKEAGLTQSDVAVALGYSADGGRSTVSKIEKGVQGVGAAQLDKLANVIGCAVNDFLPKEALSEVTLSPHSATKAIKVLGIVQAGLWMPVEESMTFEGETVRVPEVSAPGSREYFALTVQGTSMNLRFPPGTTLVCCPLAQAPDIQDGHYVIVRRCRHGDAEITVKRYQQTPDGCYLMPETNDPRWQGPVKYEPNDERLFDDGGLPMIEIVAVVVSSIQTHI